MKQLKEAWFEFAGVRSDSMGVEMLSRPKRTQGDADGTNHAVSGRAGRIWVGSGGCGNGSAEVTCMVPSGDMDAVLAWLCGAGELRFSDEPDRMYRARITHGIARTQPFSRLAGQQFTVRFDLQPYRYLYPAAEKLVLTQPGLIHNPGTAAAQPKLIIEATGDVTVAVNNMEMTFEALEDGIVVDCEAMECLDLGETMLLNAQAQMNEFPQLPAGTSTVAWRGNVTCITVIPRWRYV